MSEKLKNYDDVNADWMFADRLHKSAHKVSLDLSDSLRTKIAMLHYVVSKIG